MTEKHLKEIARGIYEGHIWTTQHGRPEDAKMCFPVLLLASQETIDEMKKEPDKYFVGYEYLDKAGPLGVNGMPMFFSIRFLSKDEWEEVLKHHDKYKAINEKFMEDEEPMLPFHKDKA